MLQDEVVFDGIRFLWVRGATLGKELQSGLDGSDLPPCVVARRLSRLWVILFGFSASMRSHQHEMHDGSSLPLTTFTTVDFAFCPSSVCCEPVDSPSHIVTLPYNVSLPNIETQTDRHTHTQKTENRKRTSAHRQTHAPHIATHGTDTHFHTLRLSGSQKSLRIWEKPLRNGRWMVFWQCGVLYFFTVHFELCIVQCMFEASNDRSNPKWSAIHDTAPKKQTLKKRHVERVSFVCQCPCASSGTIHLG